MKASHIPRLKNLRLAKLYAWSLFLTLVFELVTCLLRFGANLNSTRDTASTIGRLTCGIRIHHGYIGAVGLVIACFAWTRFPESSRWMFMIGMALLLSDLVHHFLVLWPLTGSPQFDLVYPASALTGLTRSSVSMEKPQ